jgi:hypothetical protein
MNWIIWKKSKPPCSAERLSAPLSRLPNPLDAFFVHEEAGYKFKKTFKSDRQVVPTSIPS